MELESSKPKSKEELDLKVINLSIWNSGKPNIYKLSEFIEIELKYIEGTSWDNGVHFEIKDSRNKGIFTFKVCGLRSGCGSGIIFGLINGVNTWTSSGNKRINNIDYSTTKTIFEHILKSYRSVKSYGSLITTYGQIFKDKEEYQLLIETGFKELVEYNNWVHGSQHKQILLQKTL